MNIISASRRTDIPAFYMPWLINRLRTGFVCYPNPYSGRVYTISLQLEDVHSIVFWSKNYAPLLPYLDELTERGYRFYFHYTITGSSRMLEPYVPDWHQSVLLFRELAERTSSRHVQWRFDPILFTEELKTDFYLKRFYEIATKLNGATERCYFSFAVFYSKVRHRLQKAGVRYYDPPLEEKRSLIQEMADIAGAHGITLYACCQEALVSEHVQAAHCVDGDLLAEIFPERPKISKPRPTREQCGCTISLDVGTYDSCPYGCLYCYANQSRQLALARFRDHNPEDEMLIR